MLEDDLLPLRYLNDLLFCERRVALHLIEQIWKDNQYTAKGQYAHRKVDQTANLKRGDIFHIKSQHRREVIFDEHLRQQTITAAARLHEIVRTGITSSAEWKARCKGCSLLETCMPKAWSKSSSKYLLRLQNE